MHINQLIKFQACFDHICWTNFIFVYMIDKMSKNFDFIFHKRELQEIEFQGHFKKDMSQSYLSLDTGLVYQYPVL